MHNHHALHRIGTVTGAAEYVGVSRRTFQRTMRRFGLRIDAPESDPDTHPVPAISPSKETPQFAEPVVAESVQSPPKREPNILRLTVRDFTGRNFGDAGRSRPDANSFEARYRRLKGY
jgi:hypothetical protein